MKNEEYQCEQCGDICEGPPAHTTTINGGEYENDVVLSFCEGCTG